jgi:hypothetical protein
LIHPVSNFEIPRSAVRHNPLFERNANQHRQLSRSRI